MTVHPGPDSGPVQLIATMDDDRGLTIAVYRDHDAIRIDVGGIEIMLSDDAAQAFRTLISEAQLEAAVWGLFNGG